MSNLTLGFTFAQSADCDTLTFTETTGNGTGGYGDAGNPVYTDVKNTDLVIVFPDGTSARVNKGYTPSAAANPNGSQTYLASDFGYSSIPDGVWDVTFNVYTTDTASGNLIPSQTYIVTGANGAITYDGKVYIENEVFVATSETTYIENVACEVNLLVASESCNFFMYCGVRSCLKSLMLQRCGNECDCREDFHSAMNELIVDFNAAQLAFTEKNYQCANKTLTRLAKMCGGICNDCGC